MSKRERAREREREREREEGFLQITESYTTSLLGLTSRRSPSHSSHPGIPLSLSLSLSLCRQTCSLSPDNTGGGGETTVVFLKIMSVYPV